jgi:hypothetical protein
MGGRSTRRGAGIVAVIGSVLLALTACRGSSAPGRTSSPSAGGGSTTPAGSVSASVTKSWTTFFDGSTPAATKIQLLQNGTQFASIINAQASSALASSAGAKVLSVTQTSSTAATVHYDILIGGTSALANQVGQAVLVDGGWKVGDTSFCALLALEQTKAVGCSPAT